MKYFLLQTEPAPNGRGLTVALSEIRAQALVLKRRRLELLTVFLYKGKKKRVKHSEARDLRKLKEFKVGSKKTIVCEEDLVEVSAFDDNITPDYKTGSFQIVFVMSSRYTGNNPRGNSSTEVHHWERGGSHTNLSYRQYVTFTGESNYQGQGSSSQNYHASYHQHQQQSFTTGSNYWNQTANSYTEPSSHFNATYDEPNFQNLQNQGSSQADFNGTSHYDQQDTSYQPNLSISQELVPGQTVYSPQQHVASSMLGATPYMFSLLPQQPNMIYVPAVMTQQPYQSSADPGTMPEYPLSATQLYQDQQQPQSRTVVNDITTQKTLSMTRDELRNRAEQIIQQIEMQMKLNKEAVENGLQRYDLVINSLGLETIKLISVQFLQLDSSFDEKQEFKERLDAMRNDYDFKQKEVANLDDRIRGLQGSSKHLQKKLQKTWNEHKTIQQENERLKASIQSHKIIFESVRKTVSPTENLASLDFMCLTEVGLSLFDDRSNNSQPRRSKSLPGASLQRSFSESLTSPSTSPKSTEKSSLHKDQKSCLPGNQPANSPLAEEGLQICDAPATPSNQNTQTQSMTSHTNDMPPEDTTADGVQRTVNDTGAAPTPQDSTQNHNDASDEPPSQQTKEVPFCTPKRKRTSKKVPVSKLPHGKLRTEPVRTETVNAEDSRNSEFGTETEPSQKPSTSTPKCTSSSSGKRSKKQKTKLTSKPVKSFEDDFDFPIVEQPEMIPLEIVRQSIRTYFGSMHLNRNNVLAFHKKPSLKNSLQLEIVAFSKSINPFALSIQREKLHIDKILERKKISYTLPSEEKYRILWTELQNDRSDLATMDLMFLFTLHRKPHLQKAKEADYLDMITTFSNWNPGATGAITIEDVQPLRGSIDIKLIKHFVDYINLQAQHRSNVNPEVSTTAIFEVNFYKTYLQHKEKFLRWTPSDTSDFLQEGLSNLTALPEKTPNLTLFQELYKFLMRVRSSVLDLDVAIASHLKLREDGKGDCELFERLFGFIPMWPFAH